MLSHMVLLIGSYQYKYNRRFEHFATVNWLVSFQANYTQCTQKRESVYDAYHSIKTAKSIVTSRNYVKVKGAERRWMTLHNVLPRCAKTAITALAGSSMKPFQFCTIWLHPQQEYRRNACGNYSKQARNWHVRG